MIKEYIQKMILENEDDLKKQQNQMNYLLVELEFQQNQLHLLRRENSIDKNIFSPRSYDFESDSKIEIVKGKIERIKDEISYVSERIETFLKKKNEYKNLMEEFERSINQFNNNSVCIEGDKATEKNRIQDEQKLKDNLNEIYKKTEICLALLNSDKNKCKSELKLIMRLLKDTVLIIENPQE